MPRSKKMGATWAKTRRKPFNLATLKLIRSGKVLLALLSGFTSAITQLHPFIHTYQTNNQQWWRWRSKCTLPERSEPKPQIEIRPSDAMIVSKSDSSLSSLSSDWFTCEVDRASEEDIVTGDRRRWFDLGAEMKRERGEMLGFGNEVISGGESWEWRGKVKGQGESERFKV